MAGIPLVDNENAVIIQGRQVNNSLTDGLKWINPF